MAGPDAGIDAAQVALTAALVRLGFARASVNRLQLPPDARTHVALLAEVAVLARLGLSPTATVNLAQRPFAPTQLKRLSQLVLVLQGSGFGPAHYERFGSTAPGRHAFWQAAGALASLRRLGFRANDLVAIASKVDGTVALRALANLAPELLAAGRTNAELVHLAMEGDVPLRLALLRRFVLAS